MDENELSQIVIGNAIKVHSTLGPGLLESVYERALAYELLQTGLIVEVQKPVSFKYQNVEFDEGFRSDIIVNDKVIVEVKSVRKLEQVHFKQLLTYLRLADKKLGLLINFNESLLKDGIKRIINGTI